MWGSKSRFIQDFMYITASGSRRWGVRNSLLFRPLPGTSVRYGSAKGRTRRTKNQCRILVGNSDIHRIQRDRHVRRGYIVQDTSKYELLLRGPICLSKGPIRPLSLRAKGMDNKPCCLGIMPGQDSGISPLSMGNFMLFEASTWKLSRSPNDTLCGGGGGGGAAGWSSISTSPSRVPSSRTWGNISRRIYFVSW